MCKISLEEAFERLSNGEVIGVYTDTVLGLACTIENKDKIYDLKQRRKELKLIKMIHSHEQLNLKDEILLSKIKEVWPGPTTLIFDDNYGYNSYRVPNNDTLLMLLKKLNKPLFVTSANISGQEVCKDDSEFFKVFGGIKLLDNKEDSSNIASTILKYKDGKFERIR